MARKSSQVPVLDDYLHITENDARYIHDERVAIKMDSNIPEPVAIEQAKAECAGCAACEDFKRVEDSVS